MAEDEDRTGRFYGALEDLKRRRDELQARMNLVGTEAREEWEALEQRFDSLKQRLSPLGDVATETMDEVGDVLDKAADELKQGYDRFRDRLREKS